LRALFLGPFEYRHFRLIKALRILGVDVAENGFPDPPIIPGVVRTIVRDLRLAISSNFVVLTFSGYPHSILLMLILRPTRRKVVFDMDREYVLEYFSHKIINRILVFIMLHLADLVLLEKAYAMAVSKRYDLSRSVIRPFENLPDLQRLEELGRQEPRTPLPLDKRIIAYGGIKWYQGVELILPIYKVVQERRQDTLLVIIAPPEKVERLKAKQVKLGVRGVLYLPILDWDEYARVMSRVDLSIACLDDKSFFGRRSLRIQLLEHMGMGKGCVNASTPAIDGYDFLKDGENIILIDPSNVEESANKLVGYLSDSQRLGYVGKNARRTVYHYFDLVKHTKLLVAELAGAHSQGGRSSDGV
jgi:glycosyltransferase involved in cell wall biosynthesis